MKKRVSAGFCLLLCSLVFSLGGCGSTTSVSEMTSQDAQSQEVITFAERHIEASVDEVFSLDEVNDALQKVAAGKSKGKTILKINE